ncbi:MULTISPECIES: helix-turn-helix domain-containing protein [Halorubrum]|uniref:helix-turn-helix domain-containing protein n=1 Tax=Halorubrum TaxID=56688 RepID=UPI0026B5EC3F
MDLNKTDQLILAKLREGRCTPRYLADELNRNQSYVSQRLRHLQNEGHVDRVHRGLYRSAAVDSSHVSAEDLVESYEPAELVSSVTNCSQHDATTNEVFPKPSSLSIEFGTDDVSTVVSRVCQSGTSEEQQVLESIFRDILWTLIQDGQITSKELRAKVNRLTDIDVVDLRDIHQYMTKIKNRLTTHPQITLKRNSPSQKIIYTRESPVLRI